MPLFFALCRRFCKHFSGCNAFWRIVFVSAALFCPKHGKCAQIKSPLTISRLRGDVFRRKEKKVLVLRELLLNSARFSAKFDVERSATKREEIANATCDVGQRLVCRWRTAQVPAPENSFSATSFCKGFSAVILQRDFRFSKRKQIFLDYSFFTFQFFFVTLQANGQNMPQWRGPSYLIGK